MAKAFSILSWNVEHFGAPKKNDGWPNPKPKKPIAPIIDLIAAQNADVVAIYEVVGSTIYDEVTEKMPDYQFFITEGVQTQEILIGVKRKMNFFFTQRVDFKSGQSSLRPGALLTLRVDNKAYPLLFLHLKSLTQPKGFGLRDDMTDRALKLKKKLDKNDPEKRSNFMFLGDLNTMGMNLTFSKKDVSGPEEIERLQKRVKNAKMTIVTKNQAATFWPKPKSRKKFSASDLDHVVAADHLKFKMFGNAEVDVRGWTELSTENQKDQWAKKYSDHALLYLEVQKA